MQSGNSFSDIFMFAVFQEWISNQLYILETITDTKIQSYLAKLELTAL